MENPIWNTLHWLWSSWIHWWIQTLSTQNSNHKQYWHTKSYLRPLDLPRSIDFECSHWLSLNNNHLIHCLCQYLLQSMDYSSKYLCQTILWSHQTSQRSQRRHYDSNWFSPLCQSTHRWTCHPRIPIEEEDLIEKILDGLGDEYKELIRSVQTHDTSISFDELHE